MIIPFIFQTDCKYIAFILIKKHLRSFFSQKSCFFLFFIYFFGQKFLHFRYTQIFAHYLPVFIN